jgi:hypothetical protein
MKSSRRIEKIISSPLFIKLYSEGASLTHIGKVCGYCRETVKKYLSKHIEIRKKGLPKGTPTPWMKRFGPENNNYKRGYSVEKRSGYLFNNQSKKYIHSEIVESVLGRPLKSNEVVHHLDGNGSNNAKNNLIICTQSYHAYLHYLNRIINKSGQFV